MVGGGLPLIADAMVKDVTFMLVTDVRMSAKLRDGVYGKSDALVETTRIVTTANKANLELAEAEPEIFRKHSFALAGFF